jgi:hypothetical protein
MRSLACLFIALWVTCGLSYGQKKAPSAPKKVTKPVEKQVPTEAQLKSTFKSGEYAKAIVMADQILSKKPGDPKILVVKTLSYGMTHNKEMAKKTADELYPIHKDTEAMFLATLPLNLSSEVLKRDGEWYISEAHKLSPGLPVVYLIEASMYVDDSMYDKSKSTALAGAAFLTDSHPLQLRSQFANVLHMSGAKDAGYKLMNQLLATYPDDSLTHTVNYAMLLRDKKYTEGLSSINALVTKYPDNKRLRKERAFLYEEMGRHGDACAEAVKLNSEDEVYFSLLRKFGCPQAFANLSPATVKAYTYDVDYNGTQYQFVVRPKKVKMDEGASFDWHMTINDKLQGTVDMSKEALDTAHTEMNKFAGGPSDLKDQTTVWVSNAVYRELKKDGKSIISATENAQTFSVVDDEDEATITDSEGHTRALKTMHVRSEDGQEELWINDDPANPLITRMNLGWSLQLKSIE